MLADHTPPVPVSADAAKRMAAALSKAIEKNKEAAEKLYTEMDTLCKSITLEKKEEKSVVEHILRRSRDKLGLVAGCKNMALLVRYYEDITSDLF